MTKAVKKGAEKSVVAEKDVKPNKEVKKKDSKHRGRLALEVLMITVYAGGATIVSQYVIGYLMVWIVGAEAMEKPVMTGVFSALSYLLTLVMVLAVPLSKSHKQKKAKKTGKWKWVNSDRKTLGLSGWPTWTDIGLAPVGFLVYCLLAAGLIALFSLFPWFNAEEAQEIGFSYYVNGFDRVVAFVTLVVVAPIAEEIIFRGWLYGWLREKIAAEYSNKVSMIVSIFLVSLLFGLVHGQWNVGVNVFAMSIVLCGMREITGTIYSGILLHMVKNGVAFWMLFMM